MPNKPEARGCFQGEMFLAEEMLLLMLDEESGAVSAPSDRAVRLALAGSVLLELAQANRIDQDFGPKGDGDRLFLVDAKPMGHELLDPWLASVAMDDEARNTAYWLERFSSPEVAHRIRDTALASLERRGVLVRESNGYLQLNERVRRTRTYRTPDGGTQEDVRLRIMRILDGEMPSPRDVAIVALANACGMFDILMPDRDVATQKLIDLYSGLELTGRVLCEHIRVAAKEDALGPIDLLSTKGSIKTALAKIPMAPGALPVLGHAHRMLGAVTAFFTSAFRSVGPVFRLKLVNREVVVLTGPEANMFLQRQGHQVFRAPEHYAALVRAFGSRRNLFSMDGSYHIKWRRQMAAPYSRSFFCNHLDEAAAITDNVVLGLPSDRPVLVKDLFQRLVSDQLGGISAGYAADEKDFALIRDYTTRAVRVVAMGLPEILMRTPAMSRRRAAVERLYERLLVDYAEGRYRKGGMVDRFMSLHKADPSFCAAADLMAVVVGPQIAGLDTASHVGGFMLYHTVRDPELRDRVRVEADSLFSDEDGPTGVKLGQMDTTYRVMQECLRLYPAQGITLRDVVNPFDFAGYRVPAGAQVVVGNTVPHYCAEYFNDPETFDIDRFSPGRAEHAAPGVFHPFGVGTRRCLGWGFAEAQLVFTLARILHLNDVRLTHPRRPLKVKYTGAAPSPGNLTVFVKRRGQTGGAS